MLTCYIRGHPPVSCGCETWTYAKAIYLEIDAFEMWCDIKMLIIMPSWTFRIVAQGPTAKIGV